MDDRQNQSSLESSIHNMNGSEETRNIQETSQQSPSVVLAPCDPNWLTDEELLALDQVTKQTMEKLLEDGINVQVLRFQGCENFPPLLLDKGLGVALCINKAKKNDYRVIPFTSVGDDPFCARLRRLANDRHSPGFRYKDLLFTFQITNYFHLHPPSNPPRHWRPESGAGFDIFHSSKRAPVYTAEEQSQDARSEKSRPYTKQDSELIEQQPGSQSTESKTPLITSIKKNVRFEPALERPQSAEPMSPGTTARSQPVDTKKRPPWRP